MMSAIEITEYRKRTSTVYVDIAIVITSVAIIAISIFILMNLAKLSERPEALSEALTYLTAGLAVTVLFVLLTTIRVTRKLRS